MSIPIQNIYYLLCYAWDKLEETNKVNVSAIDSTEILDLFAFVITRSIEQILKQGMDRYYVEKEKEIAGIKGKLNITKTVKRNGFGSGRTTCVYDEFVYDILYNQIIKTTIWKLLGTDRLSRDIVSDLHRVYLKFPEISIINIKNSDFARVRLNKMNHHYDMPLRICKIIHDNIFIDEKTGKYCFKDFYREESAMARLFEEFVRNFYKREQKQFGVSRERIQWDLTTQDPENVLPIMETDITLRSQERKIIIDTKYYKKAFVSRFGNDKFRSENMYQLFSYLKNQEKESELAKACEGMLLYPTVKKKFKYTFQHGNHKIKIASIDLNQDWQEIKNNLLTLVS